jgi:hypothetical protein
VLHNLTQLHGELKAAGVDVPALGSVDEIPHTYSDTGEVIPLPKAAAKIVKAHKPLPTPHEAALAALRASDNPDTKALLIVLGLA